MKKESQVFTFRMHDQLFEKTFWMGYFSSQVTGCGLKVDYQIGFLLTLSPTKKSRISSIGQCLQVHWFSHWVAMRWKTQDFGPCRRMILKMRRLVTCNRLGRKKFMVRSATSAGNRFLGGDIWMTIIKEKFHKQQELSSRTKNGIFLQSSKPQDFKMAKLDWIKKTIFKKSLARLIQVMTQGQVFAIEALMRRKPPDRTHAVAWDEREAIFQTNEKLETFANMVNESHWLQIKK